MNFYWQIMLKEGENNTKKHEILFNIYDFARHEWGELWGVLCIL